MGNTETVKEEIGMIAIQIQIQEPGIGQRKLSFITEKSLPLRRIFLDFCDQLDLVYTTVRFLFDGAHVHEDKTAEELEMEDGVVIDAFYGQIAAGNGIPLSS